MLSIQPFESFSKSQNIGIGAVEGIKSSEVYNVVTNKLKEVSEELRNAINGLIQQSGLPIDEIQDLFDENLRAVKDAFTTLQDVTGLTPKDIEKAISGFLPSDSPQEKQMQNMFMNLAAECRNNAAAGLPGFKPFPDNFACGTPSSGGGARCSTGQVSGLLNKITGGVIGSVAKSVQSMLRSVMTLANLGYSGSMCKVFAALVKNMPANVIQRSAAGLLAIQGGSGNINAVLDISSGIGGMIGINPSREISGLVGRIADNFEIPGNYKEDQYASLYDGLLTSYDIIDPGYDQSDDGLYSIAKMGSKAMNESMRSVTESWLSSGSSAANFEEPYSPDGIEVAVGNMCKRDNYSADFDDDPLA